MYENVKFKNPEIKRIFSTTYFEKLKSFITFYTAYNPIGWRIDKGVDVYHEAKKDYDNIVTGNTIIDDYIWNPFSNISLSLQFKNDDIKKKELQIITNSGTTLS